MPQQPYATEPQPRDEALKDLLAELDRTLSRLPSDHETRPALVNFRCGLVLFLHLAPVALVPPC